MNCQICGAVMYYEAFSPVGPVLACPFCHTAVKVEVVTASTSNAGPPVVTADAPEPPKGRSGGKAWRGPERAEYGRRGREERAKRPGPCVLPPRVSCIEETLAIQIKAAGLPEPVREYRFAPPRKWRLDFAWPDQCPPVAVECEGGTRQMGRHNRHEGFENDCSKYNAATKMGYRVLRYTSGMVNSGEALRDLEDALDWYECEASK